MKTFERPKMGRPPKPLTGPDDPRHGTSNAYTHHKCRCERCRKAWRDSGNERSLEYRASLRADARRYRAIRDAVTPSTALTLAWDKDADGNPVVRLSHGLRRLTADSVDEAVEKMGDTP